MWDWLSSNSSVINLVTNTLMLFVWMGYLHLIFTSFRRSNRAVIHIGMAANDGQDARCIVSNMGADAVYILAIQVELVCDDEEFCTLVTDRVEDGGPLGGDFRERTNQGPLAGGEALDIGSFQNIGERAAHNTSANIAIDRCTSMEITVVVAAQQAHKLLGGHKRYDITRRDGILHFASEDVLTKQISSRKRRSQLRQVISQDGRGDDDRDLAAMKREAEREQTGTNEADRGERAA